jgi:hypothetical protein
MSSPRSSRRGQATPFVAVALGALAAVTVAAAIVLSGPVSPPPATGSKPSATPVASAPNPSVPASHSPSPTPRPTAPGEIVLESATGHDVLLKIHDQANALVDAVSDVPGDGMSVRWHDSVVRQAGARKLAITWVALPQDEIVDLGIVREGDKYTITIVQAGPVPYSDAMGEDRVLVLTFADDVLADDIDVAILDRTVD